MWVILLSIVIFSYIFYRLLNYLILHSWRINRDFLSQGIPGYYIPIVGDVLMIRRGVLAEDPLGRNLELEKEYGSYFHSSLGPVPNLIISDPLLMQGVLKSNARCYHKSNLMGLILGTLLGYKNLLLAEDPIHGQHRRLIAPVFQNQNINSMISLMVQITTDLLDKWTHDFRNVQTKGIDLTLDIHHEMTRLTLDIVTGCVFGSGLMKNDEFRDAIYQNVTTTLREVETRIHNMIAIIPFLNRLPLPSKRRIDQSKIDVRQIIERIINDRKKGLTKSACKGPDLLDLILAARSDDQTTKFNDEEIYEEALTFVIAGHETTSNLMVWTLFNLANNPDVCRQLESEIDSVLNDNEEMTSSTLSLLTYTELVLKESLRLHQPVPFLVRTAIEDNLLTATDGKQIHVKKGTDIVLNIYTLHHSSKYWNEPFQFNPSRFNERHSDIYLPFSSGTRSCIGQNFAMLEAKVMLALIIKRFHLELVPAQKHVPEIVVTMRPKYGMWMKMSLR